MNDKEKREQFGVNMTAIEVTRVFKKPLEHFQTKGMDAFAWVLINDDTQEVIHANIYNGKVGRKWKPRVLELDVDKLQKKLKTYVPVDIADCSVAILAGLVVEDPAPAEDVADADGAGEPLDSTEDAES